MCGPVDVHDTFGRPLRNLRLSVTDRCNLRCAYCMPEEDYVWLPRADILDFEEIARIVDAFTDCGVERVRLTGGEPLLRRELPELVRLLAAKPALRETALTTNGILLAELAADLQAAGLTRVTVSLDTLRPATFRVLARRDGLERVIAGLQAARQVGFIGTKLDSVVLRGTNDDEIVSLLQFAREIDAELRFIEYMDVGGATQWSPTHVVPRAEILERVASAFGTPVPVAGDGSAPAERFLLPDGTTFGIIASTTRPFCGACDRGRLTADGRWLTCLYATHGRDLRGPLRAGATRAELAALIRGDWGARADRGAEERLAAHARGAFADREALRSNPHLEMHTRGG
ncbi:MAG: GTP 3',8-cyclase MoaA [Planctomycetes bacterium]|nr:GTP 3',8-cyclase MoaA [Planctomycetota bacterium]